MLSLCVQTDLYRTASLLTLFETFMPALLAHCVIFAPGEKPNEIKGFAVYTYVDAELHQHLLTDPCAVPLPNEWRPTGQPGESAWVMDVVALTPDAARYLVRELRFRAVQGTMAYWRRYGDVSKTLTSKLIEKIIHGAKQTHG